MGTPNDLTEEQVRILIDAYNNGGTLGGAHHAIPSIGADTVEPLIYGMARLKRALQMACTHEYFDEAMKGNLPHSYAEIAFEILRQTVSDMRWIVVGAATGALVFGAAGSAIPVVGTTAGASAGALLGAAVATYTLTGVGLITAAKFIGEISGYASVDLQEGVNAAIRGDVQQGARLLARGMAKLLAFVLPALVLMLLGKVRSVIRNKFLQRPNIIRYLAKLPAPIADLGHATGVLGMTSEEIRTLASFSRGRLMVMCGCNPLRLQYIKAGYHWKPVYIKWKTAKQGQYVGQVVLSDKEAMEVLAYYKGEPPGATTQTLRPNKDLLGSSKKVFGPRDKHGIPGHDPLKGGPWLENHKLERFHDTDGAIKYRILHPDGKPFVGDIDRILFAELTGMGTVKQGTIGSRRWSNDDARELAYLNQEMRKRLGMTGYGNLFQHGGSWHNWEIKNGERCLGWPNRNTSGAYVFDNEPLLVCCNGQAYIMGWREFAELCRCHDNVGLRFPWSNFTVK